MPENPLPSNPSPNLQDLLDSLPHKGWRLHNLYQGEAKWECRLRAVGTINSHFASYGYGEGFTVAEAVQAAMHNGTWKQEWRPHRTNLYKQAARETREAVTTDDLMGDLDL